jgi:hypothetical protein
VYNHFVSIPIEHAQAYVKYVFDMCSIICTELLQFIYVFEQTVVVEHLPAPYVLVCFKYVMDMFSIVCTQYATVIIYNNNMFRNMRIHTCIFFISYPSSAIASLIHCQTNRNMLSNCAT